MKPLDTSTLGPIRIEPGKDDALVEIMARAIHNEWEMNRPLYARYGYPSGIGSPQLPWRMLARAALNALREHGKEI